MKLKLFSIGITIMGVVILTLISLSSFKGRVVSDGYVTVKTFEYPSLYDSKLVIFYENEQIEEIILEKSKNLENMVANAKKLNETLNMLSDKGYVLVSSHGELNVGTYILEKK